MFQVLLLKVKSFYTADQRKLSFTNKDLKKVTEKNKVTDRVIQEL